MIVKCSVKECKNNSDEKCTLEELEIKTKWYYDMNPYDKSYVFACRSYSLKLPLKR